jgi:hypothetical protein
MVVRALGADAPSGARDLREERARDLEKRPPRAKHVKAVCFSPELEERIRALGIEDDVRLALAKGREIDERIAELDNLSRDEAPDFSRGKPRRFSRAARRFEDRLEAVIQETKRDFGLSEEKQKNRFARAIQRARRRGNLEAVAPRVIRFERTAGQRWQAAIDRKIRWVFESDPVAGRDWMNCALRRKRLADFRGWGRPRKCRGAEVAASLIRQALRRAGKRGPERPLVSALLLNAGLIETGCWREAAPQSSSVEKKRAWCRRFAKACETNRRRRQACRPGFCAEATKVLEKLDR